MHTTAGLAIPKVAHSSLGHYFFFSVSKGGLLPSSLRSSATSRQVHDIGKKEAKVRFDFLASRSASERTCS